ncbi:c-type cytochrome [Ottowia sp.]|uniref:c-type cytochrome n=1 Tax=Ottowia sp. TaxID=1898956 RepID=UPI002CCDC929|nr:c-type cytochrome [Ottowia sp.]MCZ2088930.1 cytochrome c4 [Burkholderiales bacterium]HNI86350.1 c-type cytochrome [Ottowia sp.]HNK53250.1 c-type cytochrome [Ottowia sp.]HNN32419.1 c-type cytochrome [Ottowia sp.]HNR82128.1 c-type cytochrome [Ottowia sp.]
MFAALGTALAMTLPVQAQVQGNATAGEGKVAMCIGCHGIAGYKSSFPEVYRVPKIAGQSAKYIGTVLEEYRKGTRKHPSMRGIAGSMSDQDIADVAAYYEALGKVEGATELPAPREPSAQVAQLLQKGACVSCHGDNYSKPIDPSYPKIAGQYPDYLYAALRAYRDDSHATWGRGNPVMAGMAKQFSDPELKAMARYIGSLPGEVRTVPQSRFR